MSGYVLTFCDDLVEPHAWRGREIVAARARARKAAAYLGPWCSRCGKRGKDCRNREPCRLRSILRYKPAASASLGWPPDEWIVARGYGSYHGKRGYYRNQAQWHTWLSASQRREACRQYAYEVAVGRDRDGIEDEEAIAA